MLGLQVGDDRLGRPFRRLTHVQSLERLPEERSALELDRSRKNTTPALGLGSEDERLSRLGHLVARSALDHAERDVDRALSVAAVGQRSLPQSRRQGLRQVCVHGTLVVSPYTQ